MSIVFLKIVHKMHFVTAPKIPLPPPKKIVLFAAFYMKQEHKYACPAVNCMTLLKSAVQK